jgi:hypothetical protein
MAKVKCEVVQSVAFGGLRYSPADPGKRAVVIEVDAGTLDAYGPAYLKAVDPAEAAASAQRNEALKRGREARKAARLAARMGIPVKDAGTPANRQTGSPVTK